MELKSVELTRDKSLFWLFCWHFCSGRFAWNKCELHAWKICCQSNHAELLGYFKPCLKESCHLITAFSHNSLFSAVKWQKYVSLPSSSKKPIDNVLLQRWCWPASRRKLASNQALTKKPPLKIYKSTRADSVPLVSYSKIIIFVMYLKLFNRHKYIVDCWVQSASERPKRRKISHL